MVVLGIETTCDETAAAMIERPDAGPRHDPVQHGALADQRAAAFGGVVPEIAARAHVEALDLIIAKAMARPARASKSSTASPPPPARADGGVIVGLTTAKAIALVGEKPLIAVNHLERMRSPRG